MVVLNVFVEVFGVMIFDVFWIGFNVGGDYVVIGVVG